MSFIRTFVDFLDNRTLSHPLPSPDTRHPTPDTRHPSPVTFIALKSDRMRKTKVHIATPGIQPPNITRTLKQYRGNKKDLPEKKDFTETKKTERPTDEVVHRLNDIGKTYPFCVYYRHQVNDPL